MAAESEFKDTMSLGVSSILFQPIEEALVSRDSKSGPDEKTLTRVRGLLGEALLFGDKVTIRLRAPSIEVVALLKFLGLRLLEKLIEEGIIEFAFAPGHLAYIPTESKTRLDLNTGPGLVCLGRVGSQWENPFDTTCLALSEQSRLPRPQRRNLARKVAKHCCTLSHLGVYLKACDLTKEEIRGGLGEAVGLATEENPDSGRIALPLQRAYVNTAAANAVLQVAAATGCNEVYGNQLIDLVLSHRLSNILKSTQQASEKFRKIVKLEGLPDIAELLDRRLLTFEEIHKLRNSSSLIRFRGFLAKIDSDDPIDVIRAYSSAVRSSIPSSVKFRIGKAAALTLAGFTLSAFDPLNGIAASLALNIVDSLLLDKIRTGWDPKVFIKDYMKQVD